MAADRPLPGALGGLLAQSLGGLVAAGAQTAASLATMTGTSPHDELAIARSPAFQAAMLAAQTVSLGVFRPAQGDALVSSVQVSPHLDGIKVVAPGALEDRLVLYFHGGAHCLLSARSHAELLGRLSTATRARCVAVNYRLAPRHPFPAGLEDALAALRWARARRPAASVAVAGDSAGGNLAFALLVKLAQLGEDQPVACVGLSPWLLLDLDRVPSVRRQQRSRLSAQWGGDVVAAMTNLVARRDIAAASSELMAGKMHDVVAAQYFQGNPASDPLVSPLLAPLEVAAAFPPVLIHADRDEPLSADAREMASLCQRAEVPVQLELYPGTAHVFQALPLMYPSEAGDSLARIGAFLDRAWPQAAAPATACPAGAGRTLLEGELAALPVSELRSILAARGLSSEGCVEKRDLVERVLAGAR